MGICKEAYTDNSPFSCSKKSYSGRLTSLATGLANASGAWSFFVIILKMLCKAIWPHGFQQANYDEKKERFISYKEMLELLHEHQTKSMKATEEAKLKAKHDDDVEILLGRSPSLSPNANNKIFEFDALVRGYFEGI